MLERRLEVLAQYNGDTVVPLPELDRAAKPSVTNLLNLGLDQFSQRIASVLPDFVFPSLRPGFDNWDAKARDSRLAVQGWWGMNRMQMLEYKRARYLLAYSSAPVTIHPVSTNSADKREIPFWRVRSPLNTFPAVPDNDLDMEPTDYIVRHEYPLSWLRTRYPQQVLSLYRTKDDQARDKLFEVLEYNDEAETVLVVIGSSRQNERAGTSWGDDGSQGSADSVVLDRVDNKAGVCNMVHPGRIVLDRPIGHFDGMLHLFTSQAKMAAYEELGIFRSTFPEQWVVSHPNAPTRPKITAYADPKNGVIGQIENGMMSVTQINPGQQVPSAIDRLERAQRLAGGIPAEMGGESPSNIRTARRGADVMSSTVDMPLQEYQLILGEGKVAEIQRAVATQKGYYGKRISMYVIPRDGKVRSIKGDPTTYTPNDTFVSDYAEVRYTFPGSDSSSIPIEIGQRVGTSEMSLQTAREMDPSIQDPVMEASRVLDEGLEKALLAGLETQLSQGALDPIVVAKIHQAKRTDPGKSLADIYAKVHADMQKEQAAAQAAAAQSAAPGGGEGAPPGQEGPAPASMPGAAAPPGQAGMGQPTIPPPPQGQLNLSQILSSLGKAPAGAPAPAPAGAA